MKRVLCLSQMLVSVLMAASCGGGSEAESPTPDAGDAGVDSTSPDTGADTGLEPSTDSGSAADDADTAVCLWKQDIAGLSGGTITAVAFDPRAGGRAYASAGSRVFRSTAASDDWKQAGEAPSGISDFAFPPSAGETIFAASGTGFLRSTDGGATWSVHGLSGFSLTTATVHPAEALRVFAGTLGSGLFRSNDGGASWTGSPLPIGTNQISSVLGLAGNRDHALAGYILLNEAGGWSDTGGVLRTTNGGTSWVRTFNGGRVHRIATCAGAPDSVWAATSAGLASSTNGGETWTTTNVSNYYLDVAVGGSDCKTIYATIAPTGVLRSTDGGATWSSPLESGLELQAGSRYPNRLAVRAADGQRVLAATHAGLFTSTNGGDAWTAAPGIVNIPVTGLTADSSRVYLTSYGTGLWERPLAGGAWKRNTGLPRDWLGGAYPSPMTPGLLLVGAYSPGGLWRSTDGTTFASVLTGNVMSITYHPTTASTVYAATQTSGVQRSTDSGLTWSAWNAGLAAWPTSAGTFIDARAVVIDPTNPNTMVLATNGRGLYRTTDGTTWAPTGSYGTAAILSLVREAKTGALFAHVPGSGVVKSTDFGATWSLVTTGLSSLELTLAADDATGDVYAATSNGMFRLASGATSWTRVPEECMPGAPYGVTAIISAGGARTLIAESRGAVVTRAL